MTSQEGSIAAPKQGGLFEDLIEVLYAPSKVFDRARNSPAFKYAIVTAIICLVVAVATKNLLMPWLDAQAELSIKMAAAKGKPLAPTFRDGLATEFVTDAILKSGKTRQWEKVGQ